MADKNWKLPDLDQVKKERLDAVSEYDKAMAKLWEERGGKPKGVDPWVETEGWRPQDEGWVHPSRRPQKPLGNDPLTLLAGESADTEKYLTREMSRVMDAIDAELSKSKPDFDLVNRLELEADMIEEEYEPIKRRDKHKPLVEERFVDLSRESVRSNKTNKPGRLAKKAFESDPLRMVVETEAGGNPRQARTRSAHYLAFENLVGRDAPFEEIDATIDDPTTRYGFSTGRERMVSRKEMARRIDKENPGSGILEESMYRGESEQGAHSGDIFDLEAQRKQTLDPERITAMTRRGPEGQAADRELLRRRRGNQALAQINRKLADPDITTERRRDLHRRKTTILEGIAQSGPGAANVVGGPRRLGKLANIARGIGKKSTKALGPLGWIAEPISTAKAIADYASGDEARMLKATEFFQGLPEGATGRGYTKEEKTNFMDQNRPWYDPRRREGGI
jgi:hypothetical protein